METECPVLKGRRSVQFVEITSCKFSFPSTVELFFWFLGKNILVAASVKEDSLPHSQIILFLVNSHLKSVNFVFFHFTPGSQLFTHSTFTLSLLPDFIGTLFRAGVYYGRLLDCCWRVKLQKLGQRAALFYTPRLESCSKKKTFWWNAFFCAAGCFSKSYYF